MAWDIRADRPVYLQLVEHLQTAVVTGEYPPGSRIPPVRELAGQAGVNPNTMQRAWPSWRHRAWWRHTAPLAER